jgi:HEAT repeat protein
LAGLIILIIAALLGAMSVIGSVPEAYYQGRSASSWLRDLARSNEEFAEALEAFKKMGTNAEPVLVAALREKENPLVRIYRGLSPRMPSFIQQHLPKAEQPALLRMAAVIALQHSSSKEIMDALYPMFKEPDSGLRLALLQAVENQVPNASQVSMLVSAADDRDPYLRSQVWARLRKLGASAVPAVPEITSLCSNGDVHVHQEAAWTLWRITSQTNTAVPALENALRQDEDANERHLIAYHLLLMGDSGPAFVDTLVNSLTNSQPTDRATVCTFLGQIGPRAAVAVPALQKALHDPEETVRRRAEVALSAIEPKQGH